MQCCAVLLNFDNFCTYLVVFSLYLAIIKKKNGKIIKCKFTEIILISIKVDLDQGGGESANVDKKIPHTGDTKSLLVGVHQNFLLGGKVQNYNYYYLFFKYFFFLRLNFFFEGV